MYFTPDANFNGNDSFGVVASDGTNSSGETTIQIEIDSVNDRPTAEDLELVTVQGQSGRVQLRGEDVEGGDLDFSASDGEFGTVSVGDDDKAVYTPNPGFTGDDSFTYTVTDDDEAGELTSAPATVSVEVVATGSAPDASVGDEAEIAENDDQVVFTLSSPASAVIRLSTDDVTAKAGEDYTGATATFTFIGSGSRQFPVKLTDDAVDEADETFRIKIEVLSGGVEAPSHATGTIVDNDPLVEISGGAVNVDEGNLGSHVVHVPVSLNRASAKTVQVNFATGAGAELAGDFVPTSGTLTFAPNQTNRTVPVTILGDVAVEPNDTLTVDLTGASNGSVAGGGSVTIVNDDSLLPQPPPPPLPPAAPTADLSVTMAAPATSAVDRTVNYDITVRNNGPSAATGVVLSDAMPGGLQFVSGAVGNVACVGGTVVRCAIGSLASGAATSVALVAVTTEPGVHTNTATVSGNEADPAAANNAASSTTRVPVPVTREPQARTDGCTQRGTAGDDVLRGGPGVDVLCGLGGNDVLIGFGGNDRLLGGAGNDRVLGGAGNDNLKGGNGKDELLGGAGDDRLDGGRGRDTLAGERGNDHLNGSYGNDFLIGGLGKDRVLGGPGNDRMRRDAKDTAAGGPGADQCLRSGIVTICP